MEFEAYKAKTKALIEYREAYFAAKARDPKAVEGLPDPDGDPQGFDPVEALDRLKNAGPARVQGVPPTDIRA